jgi:hypothetical protein
VQSHCGPLVNAEDYKRREAELKDCRAWLGPNQPGITTPDPTAEPGQTTGPPASGDDKRRSARAGVTPNQGRRGGGSAGAGPAGGGSAGAGSGAPAQPEATQLLDFLLAP